MFLHAESLGNGAESCYPTLSHVPPMLSHWPPMADRFDGEVNTTQHDSGTCCRKLCSCCLTDRPCPSCGRRLGESSASRPDRFEEEVTTMQRDSGTYLDEPEDADEFQAWLDGFSLEGHRGDIQQLVQANAFMAELQERIVPLIVEYDDFWTRYFFRCRSFGRTLSAVEALFGGGVFFGERCRNMPCCSQ